MNISDFFSRCTSYIAFILLALCLSSTVYADDKVYIINIASSLKDFKAQSLPAIEMKENYHFYSVKLAYKNNTWNRLRLGFFNGEKSATSVLNTIKKQYPDAFLGLVPKSEIQSSKATEIHHSVYPIEYLLLKTTDALISSVGSIKLPQVPTKEAAKEDIPKEVDNYFILNLKTSSDLSEFDKIVNQQGVSKHALYISELEIDNRIWYQYRLGFFIIREAAEIAFNEIQKAFPLARVIKISKEEKQLATQKIRAFNAVATPKKGTRTKTEHPKNANEIYQNLIKQGTQALSRKDYPAAIKSFNELLSYPENSFSMDAQELLGFAYELNKQISYARAEYEQYLNLYPESSGATRVQQRLASLITARTSTPQGLRSKKASNIIPKWETFGSISQFYRRDTSSLDIDTETETSVINITDKRVNLSEIDSILSLNARRRSNDTDLRARFTGGYINDLQNQDDNSAPINELYFDALSIKHNANIRVGRQRTNKGGVFGRFDGVDTGYQINDWIKMNLTTGYLVPSVTHSADQDAFFTSVKADLGTFFNAWDFSLYYMKQQDGIITGREAIGTEFRYFDPHRSLFGLVDHDILFDTTNTILVNGSWTLANKASFNATIDLRQSPLLTSQNALQGQLFTSTEEMLATFTEDELLSIAKDRSAKVKTFIAGMSYPLSDSYTFNADVTSSKISATSASAGVDVIPATDTEYFYNTQVVGNSVFKQNDSSIIGLNYNDTTTNSTIALRWNYRIPVTQQIRLNPRLSIAKRDNDNDTMQSILGIAFKMDYRWTRNTSFELELSSESSDKTLVSGQEKNDVFFVNMGYHHNF